MSDDVWKNKQTNKRTLMNTSSRAKSKLVDQIEYINVRICLAAIKRFVAEMHPVACKTAWGSCRTMIALPNFHI